MTVTVVGLGLIGASLAKAYKAKGHTVFGFDSDKTVLGYASMTGVTDGIAGKEELGKSALLFLALYPHDAVAYVKENAEHIGKSCTVLDCCGVKRPVCAPIAELAEKHGFSYIGAHPMAGTQFSGIKYSRADMFEGAVMILVPKKDEDPHLLEKVKTALTEIGFSGVTVTTAERHDEIIAYTSQLAHVVSNAYVKSPNARVHHGFSAGSYRDLTRVAKLNETMWTELFLDNRDNLINEIDMLTSQLEKYSQALKENDAAALCALLREGRTAKEDADTEWKEK